MPGSNSNPAYELFYPNDGHPPLIFNVFKQFLYRLTNMFDGEKESVWTSIKS